MATFIVGIVGSPHKEGRTARLVKNALRGAERRGAETGIIFLVDYDIKPWSEEHKRAPEELNDILKRADGYILGAPVYYLDINGLTKDFMDTIDLGESNGKPGLGIAIAGGTGKGLVLAVKSIYYFFFCKGIRGIEPLPVSRFNYDDALEKAVILGEAVAREAEKPKPFTSLEDRITYYSQLKFLDYDMIDEIILLAGQLLKSSPKKNLLEDARMEYEKAIKLRGKGRRLEALKHAVKAYESLYY